MKVHGYIRKENIALVISSYNEVLSGVEVLEKRHDQVTTHLVHTKDAKVETNESGLIRYSLTVEMSKSEALLESVDVRFVDMALEVQGWNLSNLIPADDDDFEEKFFRKKNRHPDSETLWFITNQIVTRAKLSTANIAVAAVINAYKSIDLMDTDKIEAIIPVLLKVRTASLDFPRTASPRTDREFLYTSISTALWHCFAFLEDASRFCTTLDEIIDFVRTLDNPRVLLCYSVSRAYLARAFLARQASDMALANKLHIENFKFYKSGMKSLPRFYTHFKEVMEAHKIVLLSLTDEYNHKNGGKLIDANGVFDAIQRILDPEATEALRAGFLKVTSS